MGSFARQRWLLLLVPVTVLTSVMVTSPAQVFAQNVPDPPANSNMPGGTLMRTVIGWLKYGALGAAFIGLLIGAVAVAIGHFGNNYGAGSAGRKWLLGGVGAAALAGLAHTVVTTVYDSV